MGKLFKFSFIIFMLLLVFALGVFVGVRRPPPYKAIRAAYRSLNIKVLRPLFRLGKTPSLKTEDYWKTDVAEIITIKSEKDIAAKRDSLIAFIWKGAGFPTSTEFSSVDKAIKDPRYDDLKNLQSIDRYTISMDYGVNSIIYHFKPNNGNKTLIVYHQGHLGDFFIGKKNIRFFVEKGYSVLAFAMPLYGMNNNPIVDFEHLKKVRLINHDYFRFLDSEDFSCMKFFVEPIAIALNYMEENYNYDSICMVGISGGGWTTVFYSALDPRIKKSYPVTCSCQPLFLRSLIGDYEQTVPEIYRIANTLELYIMGSFGRGRREMLVFNKYNPKGGLGTGNKSLVYKDKIKEIINRLGKGSFDVYLDPNNTKHLIGDDALRTILEDISE